MEVCSVEYKSQVVTEAVKKLYMDEKTADVHFIFKTGERVPAHKNVLAAASDVFDTMFYGSIKEKGDVDLGDASAVGFMEFLQFFYFNTIKLTMANIGDVMSFGHKYNVTECVNPCVRFLTEHCTTDNVCQVYGLAVLYEQCDLIATCSDLIKLQTEGVLQSPNFLECDRKVLNHILELDKMSCSESVVFTAAMSWVKSTSKQAELTKDIIQTHIGDLFYKIRFRSMAYDEFADLLPLFGTLFTADELTEILQMIRNEEYQPKMFSTLRRTPLVLPWNEGAIIECDRKIKHSSVKYYIKYVETTTFTTNQILLLGYFWCLPLICNHTQHGELVPVDVTISRVPNGNKSQNESYVTKVLYAMKAHLSNKATKIVLSHAIILDPKFKYKIRINTNIPELCLIECELNSEVSLPGDIVVTFYEDPLVFGIRCGTVSCLGLSQIY